MRILAIDTSGRQAGAAVTENGAVKCRRRQQAHDSAGWKHSQILLPMIIEMLEENFYSMDSFDAVAYTCGPGSFTGLRIGAATALGLARGANIRVVAVPTLDAMAYTGIMTGEKRVLAMMDARRGQVYAGVFEPGENGLPVRVGEYLADTEEAAITMAGHAAIIRDTVNAENADTAGLWAQKNFYLARPASQAGELLYIRAPQAVREKNEKKHRTKIVPAAMEHLDGIHTVELESFSDPWPKEAFFADLHDGNTTAFAALGDAGEVAGYIFMRRSFEEGHIQTFAVGQRHRGCGVGSALMQKLTKAAVLQGIEVLLLEVRQGNRAAMALYHKHGFFVDGYRKDFYRDPCEDAVLMRKKI